MEHIQEKKQMSQNIELNEIKLQIDKKKSQQLNNNKFQFKEEDCQNSPLKKQTFNQQNNKLIDVLVNIIDIDNNLEFSSESDEEQNLKKQNHNINQQLLNTLSPVKIEKYNPVFKFNKLQQNFKNDLLIEQDTNIIFQHSENPTNQIGHFSQTQNSQTKNISQQLKDPLNKNLNEEQKQRQFRDYKGLKIDIQNNEAYSNTRLYQLWPGNNRFYCKGLIMTGSKKDRCKNILTWFFIIIIGIMHFFLTAPVMWEIIHPLYPISVLYLLIQTMCFLILTQFSDPGIIPRQEIQNVIRHHESKINQTDYFLQDDIFLNKNGKKIKQKMCGICKINRPPRASHCSSCGNCVEVFDHHCPFLNNCIGKRNYKYFIGFLVSLIFTSLGMLSGFLIQIFNNFGQGIKTGEDDQQQTLINNQSIVIILLILLGIPTVFFTICILMYCGFHIYLICKGATTKEKLGRKRVFLDSSEITSFNNSQKGYPQEFRVEWCNRTQSKMNCRLRLKEDDIKQIKESQQYQNNQLNSNYINNNVNQFIYDNNIITNKMNEINQRNTNNRSIKRGNNSNNFNQNSSSRTQNSSQRNFNLRNRQHSGNNNSQNNKFQQQFQFQNQKQKSQQLQQNQ